MLERDLKSCKTCRYWLGDDKDQPSNPNDQNGECRRHPPAHLPSVVHLKVVMHDEQRASIGSQMDEGDYLNCIFKNAACSTSWGHPTTIAEHWCGEWAAVENLNHGQEL